MEVILDTSFILSCLGKKIDFLEAERFGSLVLPLQVLNELDKIKKKHGKESNITMPLLGTAFRQEHPTIYPKKKKMRAEEGDIG